MKKYINEKFLYSSGIDDLKFRIIVDTLFKSEDKIV